MAANVYECMFLLDSNKVASDIPAVDKQLRALLARHNAEVLASRPWDERRLAYPIKNHKKGLYYLTYFSTEGKNLVDIERECALNETIIRLLILRIDPKLVDTMLAVAKDEHAPALHNIHEETVEGLGAEDGFREPREPRRNRRQD